MSNSSVAQNKIVMQGQESWANDPFDLKMYVMGIKQMSNQKQLEIFAESLVEQFANFVDDQYELTLDMVPEDEQNELARLYIESTGRDISECVYGDDLSINSDFTCALLAMLKNDSKESRDHFSFVTRKNTITYYEESINEVLTMACDNFLHAVNNEQGFYTHQDREHGDTTWSKY